MSIGALAGFGGSVLAQRRIRRTVERYLPEQVVSSAGQRARTLGADVREAVAEGRLAMRAREDELRAQVEGRSVAPELGPATAGARHPGLPPADRIIDVDERPGGSRRPPPAPAPHRDRQARHRRRR
jgi:hypothetical protein